MAFSGYWFRPYTSFLRVIMNGTSYDLPYAMTSISAPALVAEYGFVGAKSEACSVFEASNSNELSPYTSSVETCTNRVSVRESLTASNKTCAPSMLFFVNSNELPNELST